MLVTESKLRQIVREEFERLQQEAYSNVEPASPEHKKELRTGRKLKSESRRERIAAYNRRATKNRKDGLDPWGDPLKDGDRGEGDADERYHAKKRSGSRVYPGTSDDSEI